jgi:hypothetical protein
MFPLYKDNELYAREVPGQMHLLFCYKLAGRTKMPHNYIVKIRQGERGGVAKTAVESACTAPQHLN